MHIDYNRLFEQLNATIDKPHEYNALIAKLIANFGTNEIHSGPDGISYTRDSYRNKDLSVSRPVITTAYYGANQSSRYLRLDGVTLSGNGFLLPRKATITALWGKGRSDQTWTLHVKRNDSPISLASVEITAGVGANNTIDVDVEAGDFLQLYLDGESVDHPIACFELAWRL